MKNVELPTKKKIIVIGGGISGIVTSYYLTRDPNNSVILLEKNKVCLGEASGQDMAIFNPLILTKLGSFNSLWRVDGPSCVHLSHLVREPGTFKFLSYYISSKSQAAQIERLSEFSF